ncbi:Uncharacterised protein [Acinetobacter phage MD-2021a]|nr:Uncharacterised protein [Acinetobacter phage MD-2021a]CAH1088693.1 Uncharacterised protein [Acinetobacter phage MD-2021a]
MNTGTINQEELIRELTILRDKMIEMEENKPPPDPKLYYTEYGTLVYEDGYNWFEVPVEVFNQFINHLKLKESLENEYQPK